jgi:hypothetical protein
MPSNSLRGSSLPSECGFARLIGFSDGVVAIAVPRAGLLARWMLFVAAPIEKLINRYR